MNSFNSYDVASQIVDMFLSFEKDYSSSELENFVKFYMQTNITRADIMYPGRREEILSQVARSNVKIFDLMSRY